MQIERDTDTDRRLVAAAERARTAWQRLWLRLRGTTPRGAARALLSTAAVALIGWLALASWPALLPFAVGGAVAYIVLPIVNRLDTFMPRTFAVLLTMGLVALLIVVIVRLMLPPLAEELGRLMLALPGFVKNITNREQLDSYLSSLPDPVREAVRRGIDNAALGLNTRINEHLDEPLRSLAGLSVWLLNSLGFVLGFLVIPTWLLIVLRDQRNAGRALRHFVPSWLAPDFWATVRIVDRAFGTYVRGQLLVGLLVGVATYVGLTLLDLLYGQPGIQAKEYAIAVGTLTGILYLVPILGPILGLIAAGLIGWTFSGEIALLAPLVTLAAQQVVRWIAAPRVERRVSDLHPALLVMAIAALSQFGLLWIFLAAPLVAIVRDLFRYTFVRLGEPPLPASVALTYIEGEPASRAKTAQWVSQSYLRQEPQEARSTPRG